MNETKISMLKNYYQNSKLNLEFIDFLFLLDLLHFQQTGKKVTNLSYLAKNQVLLALSSPLAELPFDENIFTKRELRLINQLTNDPNITKPHLPEGEVNFFSFLNDQTISPELARLVQEEEQEYLKFKSTLF